MAAVYFSVWILLAALKSGNASNHSHVHVIEAVALAAQQTQFYVENWKTFLGVPPEDRFTKWIHNLSQRFEEFEASVVNQVFIIGCNEGQEVREFQNIFPKSHAHCMEPMDSNLAILRSKGFKNDSRLTIVHTAISDFDGRAEFVGSGQQATMKRLGSYAGAQENPSAVPVQRLDSYWARYQEECNCTRASGDTFVWHIDAEGGEFLAFLGATAVLENTEMIIFECADWYGREAQFNVARKVILLENFGFETFKLGPTNVLRLNGVFWDSAYDRLNQWSNCVAVKRGSWLNHRIHIEIVFPNHYK